MQFPPEEVRSALGERIGLTEQQVQVWFSHARRRAKKQQQDQEGAGGSAQPSPSHSPARVQHPAAAQAVASDSPLRQPGAVAPDDDDGRISPVVITAMLTVLLLLLGPAVTLMHTVCLAWSLTSQN
jgi:Homeodomain